MYYCYCDETNANPTLRNIHLTKDETEGGDVGMELLDRRMSIKVFAL
jgi:hypothetical protein